MLENGGGSIVNITALPGRAWGRGFVAHGTAKAALAHYSRSAAMDLAPRIRVDAVAPGPTATSALEGFIQNDEIRTAIEAAVPLHAIGTVADISAATVAPPTMTPLMPPERALRSATAPSSRSFQDHVVRPRMVKGRSARRLAHRVASVISARPASRTPRWHNASCMRPS